MNATLDFDELAQLAPRLGTADVPCQLCAAQHSPRGARRRVLRIWRDEAFARYHCARCGARGWARRDDREVSRPAPAKLAQIRRDAAEQSRRKAIARFIWAQRRSIEGTAAETYLRQARGYRGPIPATIAYLPQRGEHCHAMVAAFARATERDEPRVLAIADHAVRGLHITKLSPDGSAKANVEPNKIMIGPSAGFPIIVAAPNDLLGLAICEGIEDALSVHEASGLGAWAAGSAGRMPALANVVPTYVECVTICAHADPAGQTGAIKLADALRARGIEVVLHGVTS